MIKTNYKFTMAVSALDCMGCTLCVKACPVTAKADKDGNPVTFNKTGKVIYLSAAEIDSILTLQCDVSN